MRWPIKKKTSSVYVTAPNARISQTSDGSSRGAALARNHCGMVNLGGDGG